MICLNSSSSSLAARTVTDPGIAEALEQLKCFANTPGVKARLSSLSVLEPENLEMNPVRLSGLCTIPAVLGNNL